jgi:carnitine O-palmitoyltransferase 2
VLVLIILLFAGQGFDRHLFALKELAKRKEFKAPLFDDPCYSYMNDIILSTSTLSSDAVLLGGFAPVSPTGYGVGYGVMDDWLGLQITTYPTRDGGQMVEAMGQVLDDMYKVLNGENFK